MNKKRSLEQKIIGVLLIVLSLIVMELDNDGTAAVIFVPFGIYMIFTKTNCLID